MWGVALPSPSSLAQVKSAGRSGLLAYRWTGLCVSVKDPEKRSGYWLLVCFNWDVKIIRALNVSVWS